MVPSIGLNTRCALGFIQLMLYLTDVDETTHCFSLSPESVDAEILESDAQLERGGYCRFVRDPPGTAILFNIGVFTHRDQPVPLRKNARQCKSITVHPNRRYLSEDSLIPVELWRDHSDPEVRAFYSVLNNKTRRLPRTHGFNG